MHKRKEWAEKYGVSESVIYQLYSEFSSMIMIAKADDKLNIKSKSSPEPSPIKVKLQASAPQRQEPAAVSKEEEVKKVEKRLDKAMPASHKVSIAKLIRQGPKANPYKIEKKDLNDFRIPVKIFRQYCSMMKMLNREVQKSFLHALGIDPEDKYSKVSWEKFIKLSCLLSLNTPTEEDYINFFQRVIDPHNLGKVP